MSIIRECKSFPEYVRFVSDMLGGSWEGYTKDGVSDLKLENILGEPDHYPCQVAFKWTRVEGDDRSYSMPSFGTIQSIPTFVPFVEDEP